MDATDLLKIGGVIAFALPPLIAFITQTHWSSQLKGLVAFVCCTIAGLLMILWQEDFDWRDWRNATLVIVSGAIFFYHQFWKPSGIAPSIEKKTTV